MRLLLFALCVIPMTAESLPDRTQRYFIDLIKLNTSNAPGNETLIAKYLQAELAKEGIASELLGGDPNRLNIVARLKGKTPNAPCRSWPPATSSPSSPNSGPCPPSTPCKRTVSFTAAAPSTPRPSSSN